MCRDFDPGGIKAMSRGLSEATSPDHAGRMPSIPAGMPVSPSPHQDSHRGSGIPAGMRICRDPDPVVSLTLNHRLMALIPPGSHSTSEWQVRSRLAWRSPNPVSWEREIQQSPKSSIFCWPPLNLAVLFREAVQLDPGTPRPEVYLSLDILHLAVAKLCRASQFLSFNERLNPLAHAEAMVIWEQQWNFCPIGVRLLQPA